MSLGWSYAMSGHRTLLVDCDFYGRNLTTQMGLSHQAGLREALRSRRLNGEVQGLGVENLSGLGIGLDPTFGPESIRRGDFLNLCNGLRRSFDIIIADTGPFVGSVELLPVAAASNGVLFAVRRGRSRARLTECIRDLNSIKVPCLGVVLNRAGAADCARYISKSTVSRPEFLDEESSMPTVTQNPLLRALTSAGSESDTETVGESQR
jgi:Mrp family chromosome partitioning ATPase